ncbi:MAG: 16S rRNA (uracil(1498)-N(3))-methyltransferase [Eubacterium sp.]|nr:16S rRNA (uracil(1498)-N(3))-methyltransferase [Eubacterium sp.]
MHRFFVENIINAEKSLTISGQDVNHIVNVLRLGVNDDITVSDGSSRDYECRICSIDMENQTIIADIIDIYDNNSELPVNIYLFQGYPKGDKFELIVQKCVELGVHAIVPVMMDRTIVKLEDKKKSKKLQRLNSISEAAAKQSRRGIIPEVMDVMTMKEAVSFAGKQMDYIVFPYELAEGMEESRRMVYEIVDKILQDNNPSKDEIISKNIGIFIGPEGGFSDSEAASLKEIGAYTISLGHRILRTETAGMSIMSILAFLLDEDK